MRGLSWTRFWPTVIIIEKIRRQIYFPSIKNVFHILDTILTKTKNYKKRSIFTFYMISYIHNLLKKQQYIYRDNWTNKTILQLLSVKCIQEILLCVRKINIPN